MTTILSPLFIRSPHSPTSYSLQPKSSFSCNHLRPRWAGCNGPHRPATGHNLEPGCAGTPGGRDPRRSGRGCLGPETRRRGLGGGQRLGCGPGVYLLREPPRDRQRRAPAKAAGRQAGTRSGTPRAMGLGNWCGRPLDGTRRRHPDVRPPAPPRSGAAARRGPACAPRCARPRPQRVRALLPLCAPPLLRVAGPSVPRPRLLFAVAQETIPLAQSGSGFGYSLQRA